jgi:hypothetical protein
LIAVALRRKLKTSEAFNSPLKWVYLFGKNPEQPLATPKESSLVNCLWWSLTPASCILSARSSSSKVPSIQSNLGCLIILIATPGCKFHVSASPGDSCGKLHTWDFTKIYLLILKSLKILTRPHSQELAARRERR